MVGRRDQGAAEPPQTERPELVIRLGGGSGGGRAPGLMKIWRAWEGFASWMWSADALPGSPYGALRIRKVIYKRSPLRLQDGTEVREGDPIVELHLNNRVLADIATADKWRVMSAVKEELRAAAEWANSPEGREVKALFGETIIARTAVWLGFELIPGKVGVMGRFKRMYLTGLLQIYSHLGSTRLERGSRGMSVPDEVWMSRTELLSRYG